ncbi:MAG: hypothetical protein WC250_03980 [Candidatus Paceibacterota bacterium]|jgi:hypothetical protein
MPINVEITRNPTENNLSALRRFTKRVQGSGVLPRVRGIRYQTRKLSSYKVKMKTLKVLARRAEVAKLIKLGKMAEKVVHGKRTA